VVPDREAGPALFGADLDRRLRHPLVIPPGTDKNAWSPSPARR
jgi:hypothetical protein